MISDRNRVEDLIGVPGDPWRYRHRLSAEYPVTGWGPLSSLFASEEIFYDLQVRRWSPSRAQIGFGLALSASAELRVYYLRQDDRFIAPRVVNALGVTLAFDFK